MSMAIGHFALGVGATTAVVLATKSHKKMKNTEPVRIAGGIWALLPDIGKLIPFFERFHNCWWIDIFWFHRFLDTRIDPTDSVWISLWFIAFMLLMLGIFWKVVRR